MGMENDPIVFSCSPLLQTANDVAADEREVPFRLLGELLIVVRQSLFPCESIATAVAHQMLWFIISPYLRHEVDVPVRYQTRAMKQHLV